MAVYKEGYMAIEAIERQSVQIYPDAADFGAPTKKGDKLWNYAGQVVSMFGDKETRKEERYSTGSSVSCRVELLDEGAYMDERKTAKEAEDNYRIEYVTCKTGKCKGYNGFLTITKL